jgi:hypothetical protein
VAQPAHPQSTYLLAFLAPLGLLFTLYPSLLAPIELLLLLEIIALRVGSFRIISFSKLRPAALIAERNRNVSELAVVTSLACSCMPKLADAVPEPDLCATKEVSAVCILLAPRRCLLATLRRAPLVLVRSSALVAADEPAIQPKAPLMVWSSASGAVSQHWADCSECFATVAGRPVF